MSKLRNPRTILALATLSLGAGVGCSAEGGEVETVQATNQALNQYFAAWPTTTVNVCFDASVANDTSLDTWRAQLAFVVRQEWGMSSALNFASWANCNSVTFGAGWIRVKNFLNADGTLRNNSQSSAGYQGGGNTIEFGKDARTGAPTQIVSAVILHEFGHALGFTHEFQRQDNVASPDPNCPTPSPASPFNINYSVTPGNTFGVGYYNGIMNTTYCSNLGIFTENDIISVQGAYGQPEATGLLLARDAAGVPYVRYIRDGSGFYAFGSGLPNKQAKLLTQDSERHILAIGADDQVYVEWHDSDGSWYGFVPFGNGLPDGKAKVVTPNQHNHILAIGGDDRVYVKWFGMDLLWHDFSPFGEGLPDQKALAISPNLNNHILAIGADNKVYVKWFSGGIWNGFSPFGGGLPSEQAKMVTPNINNHVLAIGADSKVYVKWFSGGVWNGFSEFGSGLPSGQAKLVTPVINNHILAIGIDDQVYVKWFSGGVWNGFSLFNTGLPNGTAKTVTPVIDNHLFAEGTDGQIYVKWIQQDGTWHNWQAYSDGRALHLDVTTPRYIR